MPEVAFKKVTSKGKRYVYLRNTNIALVRDFKGTEAELDLYLSSYDIQQTIADHYKKKDALLDGWRKDAARMLHKITSKRSQRLEREYLLSDGVILQLLHKCGDHCQITGIKFEYGPNANKDWLRRPLAPSLDRIDNSKGYTVENVRLVCVCVNISINEWGLENFEKMCRAFVIKQDLNNIN